MNPLVAAYLKREKQRHVHAELRRLANEIREGQAKLAPLIASNLKAKRERMRQDGERGFVMVQK